MPKNYDKSWDIAFKFLPAWLLMSNPTLKISASHYNRMISLEHIKKTKLLIKSKEKQENEQFEFENVKNGFEIQNKKGCYKVDLITPVLGSNLRELNNNGTDIKRNEDGFFLKRRNEVNVFDISIIGDLSVNINSILNCDFFDNSSKLLVVTQKPIENLSNSLVNTNDWQILNICNLKQ